MRAEFTGLKFPVDYAYYLPHEVFSLTYGMAENEVPVLNELEFYNGICLIGIASLPENLLAARCIPEPIAVPGDVIPEQLAFDLPGREEISYNADNHDYEYDKCD